MPEYCLIADVFEGQKNINWDAMEVDAVIIRLNDMAGGHHMDAKFNEFWNSCNKIKSVYFVYNPWVSGQENYNWLAAHMPSDAKTVFLDVEVRKTGYSPLTYAQQFEIFYNLVKSKWSAFIYTGYGYLDIMSYWPKDARYWWAQYPSSFYPEPSEYWTWQQMREKMITYLYPYNADKVPGILWAWQFTGDAIILPGSSNELDVSRFYGSYADLEAFLGGATVPPKPENPFEDRYEYFSNNRIQVAHKYRLDPVPHQYHVAKFKKSDVDFVNITGKGFFGTGSYYFSKRTEMFGRAPDLIKQMDEGDYTAKVVKGLGVSGRPDGTTEVYKTTSSETNVQWDKNSNILGISNKMLAGCHNATGGSNWLVDNGEVHWSVLDDPVERDPRSGLGWDDEYYYWIIVDGRNVYDHNGNVMLGLGKAEFAELFIREATNKQKISAHNSDGGDSNYMGVNVNGSLKPLNTIIGFERQLVQYGGVWLKEDGGGEWPEPPIDPPPVEPPPEGETMNYVTKNKAGLRSNTQAVAPHTAPSMYSTALGDIAAGTEFEGTREPITKVENNQTVTFVDYKGLGWLPMIWNGVVYVEELVVEPPPVEPPPTEPETVDVEINMDFDFTELGLKPKTETFIITFEKI